MLLKRAPWPHYRIEAELCHLEGPRGKVGLCFFHQLARPPSRVQGYFKLHFTDQMHGLSLVMAEIVAHIPGEGTRELDLGMHLLNSRPRRGRLPIRWRRVNIEVRNNSVMIEWENLRFLLKRSQLIASWNAACPLKRIRPSLNLQGGIGLHVSKGKASFRNVRIVPLSTD